MSSATKTLQDIRSEACNAILLTLTLLAIPAVGFSLLRALEQGWRPIMAVHIALLLVLGWATIRRNHLGLNIRAGIAVAVPYIVATSGLIVFGRGNGVMMFYITATVVAGCFFKRRAALGVVALCVATMTALYVGHRMAIFAIPLTPTEFDMTPLSWAAFGASFLAAGIAPLIGLSAVLRLLDAERQRADEAAKVRSDFLANMSHELRTPMAGILGMADVLKSTPLTDQQRSLIANLTISARNLLGVFNDVLDIAKFESGQIPIEKAPLRVSDIARNVCALFENRALQKGISLRLDMRQLIADDVIGDGLRIGQVLTNLIDNAVKFTPRGAVAVRVSQSLRGDGDIDLICAVADTGIGVSAEEIHRIFEPFIQADMSSSRMHGGTGLGLSICRHLTQAMGGELTVSSQSGEGSTFTVTVPVQRALPPPVSIMRTAASTSGRAPVAGLRILVADDDRNMRTLAEIMLQRRGHTVTVVEDGGAMVKLARSEYYDCLIVDMHMPVMNGREVLRALHAADRSGTLPRPPMIALTADVLPEHVRLFVESGADAVVAKPVDWNLLDAKIHELAGRRQATKAS